MNNFQQTIELDGNIYQVSGTIEYGSPPVYEGIHLVDSGSPDDITIESVTLYGDSRSIKDHLSVDTLRRIEERLILEDDNG